MSTILQRGMNLLASAAASAAGGQIVYTRGASTVTLLATFGRTEFQVEDANGIRIEMSDRDFIVASEYLLFSLVRVIPQRGDKITVINAGSEATEYFEVLAPGGAQPYRLCDPEGYMIRIHCKRCPA